MCVLQYSLAYACLKLVNYSFFFWLPFYLSNNYGWKEAEADRLSVWYDVGGILGEWQSDICILGLQNISLHVQISADTTKGKPHKVLIFHDLYLQVWLSCKSV